MIFIVTILLDGIKFLPIQLATFNRLKTPWRWIVVEGQSKSSGCTSWCADMPARLSTDGSHEWLKEVSRNHPNVIHAYEPLWDGKLAMFNRATRIMSELAASYPNETHTVLQCDVDELWRHDQIDKIHATFEASPSFFFMRFWCRYFLGPNLVITNRGNYGNHQAYEWTRAFRWFQGFHFTRHEPPQVNVHPHAPGFTNDQTERMGLVFDHQAYFYESQVVYKEKFYQYPNAVEQWRALQAETRLPCLASKHLTWITDGATVDRLYK